MVIKSITGRIIYPDKVEFGTIAISDGRIVYVGKERAFHDEGRLVVPDDQFVAPGFIDIQINGAFGKEFKSDEDSLQVVSKGIVEFGTTSICPAVTVREYSTYPSYISSLFENFAAGQGAKILGLHLEGPFLNPKKAGAHNLDLLKVPAETDFDQYINEKACIITLSPELDGSERLINEIIARGIKVGVGHSLISYDQLVHLFRPQDMMIVHAFNAMADLNSRSPGVIGAAMDRDEYYVSLIADGIHVSCPSLRILYKTKRDKSKIICISDGSAVSGLPEGVHNIGLRAIEKRPDRAVLQGTETLVGSILTLDVAVGNMMTYTGCSINEAINMVTLNPATYLGRQHQIGQIKEGNCADIVVVNSVMQVQRTIVDGVQVWSRH